ncbi:MAG: ATP-binding cassette domain-containing protein [Proteobacteria bacterium]|nr:ATP-binding cassette domain-containing protein [Pseudomonadota bacterium]
MAAPAEPVSTPPLIELRDADIASAQSPDTALVENVNWRLHPGDFWAVGGLQWAGKSDWLTTVAGLQRPATGQHLLFGEPTPAMTQVELLAARRRIGLVFENGGRLFSHLTVEENVALPFCYHHNCPKDEARETVAAVLQLTGVGELAGQLAGQLNRSWRQRVALARALVLQPEVLLLDNPLAGLDPRQTRWWLETLDALNAGHAWMNGRPLTLVATADELRLWGTHARRFGWLQDRRWLDLGGRAELAASGEPSLQDILAA